MVNPGNVAGNAEEEEKEEDPPPPPAPQSPRNQVTDKTSAAGVVTYSTAEPKSAVLNTEKYSRSFNSWATALLSPLFKTKSFVCQSVHAGRCSVDTLVRVCIKTRSFVLAIPAYVSSLL